MPDTADRSYYLIVAVLERVEKLELLLVNLQQVPIEDFRDQLVDYMLDYDYRVKAVRPHIVALNTPGGSEQQPGKVHEAAKMDKNFLLRFEERYLELLELFMELERNFTGELDPFEESALLEFGTRTEDLINYITVAPVKKGENKLKKTEVTDPLESIGFFKKKPEVTRLVFYPLPNVDEKGLIIEVGRQGKVEDYIDRILSKSSSKIVNEATPKVLTDGNKNELLEVIRKKTVKERLAFSDFIKKNYEPSKEPADESMWIVTRLPNVTIFGKECRKFEGN
jgi:hypothetical protein